MSQAVLWPVIVLSSLVAGYLAANGSLLLIALPIGLVAVVVGVLRRPQLVLAVGAVCTLAGGDFAVLSRLGHGVLVVSGAVAVLLLLPDRSRWMPRLIWLPLVTLGWLTVRLGLGDGISTVRPFVSCMAAVLLAALCLARERDWLVDLGGGSLGFVLVSMTFGTMDPTGLRFEGISGNPNRMVFGLLVGIPLMAELLLTRRSILLRIAMIAGIAGAVRLITISGSSQGAVGIAMLLLAWIIYATRERDRFAVATVLTLGAAVLVAYAVQFDVLQSLSTDTTTLSGRTMTFRSGWLEFQQNFWLGSGDQHVDAGILTARSAHNSTIGIAASTGIVGLLLWVSFLVRGLRFGVIRLRRGHFAAAAAISVVISQLVQTVEVVPLTWAALTLCAPPLAGDEEAR